MSPKSGETVELLENLPAGSIVCKVQISDKDSGDNAEGYTTVSLVIHHSATCNALLLTYKFVFKTRPDKIFDKTDEIV